MMTKHTKENTTWGETLSEWTASLFLQNLSHSKTHDGAKSRSVYFQNSFKVKNQQKFPEGVFCMGPMKHMWWLEFTAQVVDRMTHTNCNLSFMQLAMRRLSK